MATPSTTLVQAARDYQRVEKVLHYLETHATAQPRLEELSGIVDLSPFHFQRLFQRWVGLSPKQFLEFLSLSTAKRLLEQSRSILDVTLDVGLSSPGRLHDLFVKVEAMTPGEYKQAGEGLQIRFGIHPTPFGEGLVAVTARGICMLSFVAPTPSDTAQALVAELHDTWPRATIREDRRYTHPYMGKIFGAAAERDPPLPLLLKGTPFQIQVWQALLRLPPGAVVSYEQLAQMIRRPRACRAVANAVAGNPIAYVIPCHRVIQKMGVFGGYRGGCARKQAMLAREHGAMHAVRMR
ncbi:MAG: methylated-DNA--[protein]-cysteine S-methyltransferase [Deltaproteobacteria bacterium]|nr:methylated-DNA--[protein]-cysteine S-methyltransferase [Deltaproteobacteria bacterium]